MTDTRSTKYYFLPIEIIHLLIDKIPLYQHDTCKQVEFFANHPSVSAKLCLMEHDSAFGNYEHIKDAIKRNDVEYCRQYYTTENIQERDRRETYWDCGSYIKQCGVYVQYWQEAIKGGRIEIMKIFYEVDTRAKRPAYNPSHDGFDHKHLIKLTPNSDILRWFLEVNCDRLLASSWIGVITLEATRKEYIDCLMWLHTHVPKIVNHPSVSHTYLEYAIMAYAPVGYPNDLVRKVKNKRPKVLNWCQQQSWNIRIDWDNCQVL
jgi:hypothetical protein